MAKKLDELNEMLNRKEQAGMAHTKRWIPMWDQNLRYFFSDQLDGRETHKDWDWVVVNYIWPAAIAEMAKLAKNNPKIIVQGREDSDIDSAAAWQGVGQWLWNLGINDGEGMRLQQVMAIFCGKVYGYRISKVFWEERPLRGWDDKNKRWTGQIRHRLWHPTQFWASDKEKIQEGDVGTTRFVDVEWAKVKWPQFTKKIEDQGQSFKDLMDGGGETIRGQISTAGTYPAAGLGGVDKGVDIKGDVARNYVLDMLFDHRNNETVQDDRRFIKLGEWYMYDFADEPQKLEEPVPKEELLANGDIQLNGLNQYIGKNGKPITAAEWPVREVKSWKNPLYPNGRFVNRLGDDIILNPKLEDQQYPYSQWPFIVTPHYLLPFMWQGVDAVQMYKTHHDMINVTVSHMVNNMKMFGDPKVLVEKGALDADPKTQKAYKILKGAGSVIRLALGGRKRFEIVPPMPLASAHTALYQLFTQEFQNIVGLQDIAQGKAPRSGDTTAREASILAISANDRIALQSIYEDSWVKQTARTMLELAQKHYEAGRWVRIIGEDEIVGITQIMQQQKNMRFDVEIVPGTTLPFDEERNIAKLLQANELLLNPTPTPILPEILRAMEIPKWKEILQQHAGWVKYVQFLQLYEGVMAGEITVQDAVQKLFAEAMQAAQQQQANQVPRRGPAAQGGQ